MTSRAVLPSATRPCDARLRRVLADQGGASALEFALIAPIALVLYAGVATMSEAIMVQQRTSHMDSAVGDLVAQQQTLPAGYVTNAMAAGAEIMTPMRATYVQRVTSIVVQTPGVASIAWSCPTGSPAYATGKIMSVPTGTVNLLSVGDSAILSETSSSFSSPMTVNLLPSGFNFKYSFWLKPRFGSAIPAPTSC